MDTSGDRGCLNKKAVQAWLARGSPESPEVPGGQKSCSFGGHLSKSVWEEFREAMKEDFRLATTSSGKPFGSSGRERSA